MSGGGVGIRADLGPGVGGRVFRGQELRLAELVLVDEPLLERARFEDCILYGPAIILPLDGTDFGGSTLGASADAVFWPIPPRLAGPGGAILAVACVFERCTFIGVGLAVEPEQYFGGSSPGPALGDDSAKAAREADENDGKREH